jgi:prefoldin subunit 5
MDQALVIKASMLEKKMQEAGGEIEFVEKELTELSRFSDNLGYLISSKDNIALSSLGKGVLIKTELKEKELFVDVGSGVIVRKEPEEVRNILKDQIAKLAEARMRLIARAQILRENFFSVLKEIEKNQQTES